MYLQMDPLNNPLRTRPIQTGNEMSIVLYLNWQFRIIDDQDRWSGSGSVPTGIQTQSDGPEPFLTLCMAIILQETVDRDLTVQDILPEAFTSQSSMNSCLRRGEAAYGTYAQIWSASIDEMLCTQSPLIWSQRQHDENERNKKTIHTGHWGTYASEVYCRYCSVFGLEWCIPNQVQLVKLGYRKIQASESGMDCRSEWYLNFNYWPGNTWQHLLQHLYKYPCHVSASNALRCRSEVHPNNNDMPV